MVYSQVWRSTSHTVIMVCTLGVAAVVGATIALTDINDGDLLVWIAPPVWLPEQLQQFTVKQRELQRKN